MDETGSAGIHPHGRVKTGVPQFQHRFSCFSSKRARICQDQSQNPMEICHLSHLQGIHLSEPMPRKKSHIGGKEEALQKRKRGGIDYEEEREGGGA